jgi:hypothetical protein
MRKSTFSAFSVLALSALVLLASCKDDSYLLEAPPVADQSFVEEFDTVQNAYNKGWRFINRSEEIGPSDWGAGMRGEADFMPYSSRGNNTGYLSTDYQATAGATSVISNWAVSPAVTFQNGDRIVFYSRCRTYASGTDFGNRLQLRINTLNDGLNVGDQLGVGDFETALVDINPSYLEQPDAFAYPNSWTRFEGKVYGLNKPAKGRFAFRYFVEGAGSNGRGSAVGVDSVAFISVNHK